MRPRTAAVTFSGGCAQAVAGDHNCVARFQAQQLKRCQTALIGFLRAFGLPLGWFCCRSRRSAIISKHRLGRRLISPGEEDGL